MKRIKTITSHDVYNYGASLQAYALMKYLQERGCEVQVIDYKPSYANARYNFWYMDAKYKWENFFILKFLACLLLAPKRFYTYERKKAFDSFTLKYLCLTKKKYFSYDALKEDAELCADVFIVGSDQVWNSNHANGKDPANYLGFVRGKAKKMSYAASFGMDHIEKGYELFVKQMLENFELITVREKHGVEILSRLGIVSKQVVDPVFLLDKEKWNSIAESKTLDEDYILVYDFGNNPLIKVFAQEYARKHKVKIYSINDFIPHRYADKNINNAGPEAFLNWIRNAKCFISNSFHGTAFSIIYEIPFWVFKRKDCVNSRMDSLLDMVGLENRVIEDDTSFERMDEDIDYQSVKRNLERNITFSKEILLRSTS